MMPSRSSRLRIRAESLDQAAGEYHRLKIRLQHKMTAECLHDDHGFDRSAAETARLLGKRRGEQAEIGEFLPVWLAPAILASNDRAAPIEIVTCPQHPLDGVLQDLLFVYEFDVHRRSPLTYSQTQHRFGDDVALDFVGAAVDR